MPNHKKQLGTDPLLPRIEKALIKSGLSRTSFCYNYFGDPTFLKKMRGGRKLQNKTRVVCEALFEELGV